MLRNEVCECRASGVFLRLSAQGLIAENDIHSNGEAGLDIRKGANPIIVVIAVPFSMKFWQKEAIHVLQNIFLKKLHLIALHRAFNGISVSYREIQMVHCTLAPSLSILRCWVSRNLICPIDVRVNLHIELGCAIQLQVVTRDVCECQVWTEGLSELSTCGRITQGRW